MSDGHQADDNLESDASVPPSAPRRRPRAWLPYAILALVFIAGGATGGAAMRAYMHQQWRGSIAGDDANKRTRVRLRVMVRRLDLNDEQRGKIRTILQAGEERRQQATAPCRDQLDASKAHLDEQFAEVLSRQQFERFKNMRWRGPGRDRGHSKRRRRRGPR